MTQELDTRKKLKLTKLSGRIRGGTSFQPNQQEQSVQTTGKQTSENPAKKEEPKTYLPHQRREDGSAYSIEDIQPIRVSQADRQKYLASIGHTDESYDEWLRKEFPHIRH